MFFDEFIEKRFATHRLLVLAAQRLAFLETPSISPNPGFS